jgi:5-methylcytosine-specific restriction endonuclease McrA
LLAVEERTGERTCCRCGVTKKLTEDFHKDSNSRLGRSNACKDCLRPEKAASRAAWRELNPDVARERVRMLYEADPAAWNAKRRARYDPEKQRVQQAADRARRARAEGCFTGEDWLWLRDLCGGRCAACGAGGPLEPDHVVPISWGGSNWPSNLQPLCRSCNASKGDRHATDYRSADVSRDCAARDAVARARIVAGMA